MVEDVNSEVFGVDDVGPSSLSEAVSLIRNAFPADDLAGWAAQPEDTAVLQAHFGLGLWVRNNWIYGGGSPLAGNMTREAWKIGVVRATHPDDMSALVLRALWRVLNGEACPTIEDLLRPPPKDESICQFRGDAGSPEPLQGHERGVSAPTRDCLASGDSPGANLDGEDAQDLVPAGEKSKATWSSQKPVCLACEHLRTSIGEHVGTKCAAFPEGIPDDIRRRGAPHDVPRDGDHGIVFQHRVPPKYSPEEMRRIFASAAHNQAMYEMGAFDDPLDGHIEGREV